MPHEQPAAYIIRVVLVDDHDILRQGLKMLLGLQPDIQVIGEARTGVAAVALASELLPDVLVLDISMAEMDGLEACRRIRSQHLLTQVLILTMHESEDYFLQALRAGAAGYLVKKAAPSDLHAAIRAIAHGGAFLYPGLAKALIRAYVTPFEEASTPGGSTTLNDDGVPLNKVSHELAVLTRREMEVLTQVAEGHTNQEIADALTISIKTVQAHRASVMEKLGLHDITQLVRFALRHGLIREELL